ncbi:MAG: proteasome accessory factor PafA2 family protein [Planctomycetota bacterium]
MKILDRLMGLETEYAIRFHPREHGGDSPSRFQLYQALIARIRRHVPAVPAKHFKEGVFLANGGAVWFETERPAAGGGLIEGATPECRGPGELLRYQRAQDQLLGQSAGLADLDGKFSLVKNDRDAAGHVYGAQENYEALLHEGWSFWHVGLVLLLPLLLLTWLGMALMMCGVLIYLILAGLVYLFCYGAVPNRRQLAFALFGRDLVEGKPVGGPTPIWLEGLLLWLTRAISLPLALGLLALVSLTAFRRARRQLTPFLVSRSVIAGAGMVDQRGGFLLADKAPAINTVLGLGGFFRDRPIFTMGHLFKALCAESWMSPRVFFQLFRRRQRLQIGLGDSNMAELAEFLRVGTTSLVLDVIEAGAMPPLPALSHPIQALHRICGDPSLRQSVSFVDGRQMTALGIQRFYLDACRAYVEQAADAPTEAFQVLDHWEETLNELEVLQATGEIPARLIGGIDWITKKKLLQESGSDVSWNARKKIDIAYHELTPFGYFQMLHAAGLAVSLVDLKATDRAVRTPPSNTPATMRGHYIREFSSDAAPVTANWSKVIIPGRSKTKTVYLDRYARRRQPDSCRTQQKTPRQ